jgi:hypothetical protein
MSSQRTSGNPSLRVSELKVGLILLKNAGFRVGLDFEGWNYSIEEYRGHISVILD